MNKIVRVLLAGLLACALLGAPTLGLAKEKKGSDHAMKHEKLIKELQLTPEQAKEFQAQVEKFRQERQTIIEALEQDNDQLKTVMAAPKPDEAKIKDLVGKIVSAQEKLFTSFRNQRDAELVIFTPEQQGKYFLIMAKWHKKMMEKWEHRAAKKEKAEKKPKNK